MPGDVNRKFRLSNRSNSIETNRTDWSNQSKSIELIDRTIELIDRTIESNRTFTCFFRLIGFDLFRLTSIDSIDQFDRVRLIRSVSSIDLISQFDWFDQSVRLIRLISSIEFDWLYLARIITPSGMALSLYLCLYEFLKQPCLITKGKWFFYTPVSHYEGEGFFYTPVSHYEGKNFLYTRVSLGRR